MQPFLVIGAGRGGTSLLAACLGGHPGIFMRSEYKAADILFGANAPIRSIATLLDDRLLQFRQVCDDDRARHHGLLWGNKITTEQLGGLDQHNRLNQTAIDVVARFAETMADYRIVFILRDGRSCLESKARRTGVSLIQAALLWCYSVRVFARLSDIGAVCESVRYEDLVRSPRPVLSRVCRALGIYFHPEMLNQTSNPELLAAEYRHGRFVAEKATQIPLLPDEVLTIIEPDLRRHGYLR